MFWTPLAQEIKVIAGSAPISVLRNHPLVSLRHVIWKKKFWTPLTKENKISKIRPPAIVSQRQRKLHNTRCLVLS